MEHEPYEANDASQFMVQDPRLVRKTDTPKTPPDMHRDQPERKKHLKKSLVFAFSFIGEIGFATALPLVIFGLLGRYLDNRYHTGNILFLIGLGLGTVTVVFLLCKIVIKAEEEFKKITE